MEQNGMKSPVKSVGWNNYEMIAKSEETNAEP